MEHFWDISETIPKGFGFSYFKEEHLFWLIFSFLFIAAGCVLYVRLKDTGRRRFRFTVAALLVLTELFKQVPLVLTGNWLPCYLPFHLCSVNIFLVVLHAWKPGRTLDNFLYAICLPAAVAALLFPGWNDLPVLNFMYLHSYGA